MTTQIPVYNQKKSYFVDGHEKPAIVAYWDAFISRYFEYERST